VVISSHKWLQLPDTTLATYNCWDTYTTARLTGAIKAELADNHQLEYFTNTYWPLVPAVMAMAQRGLHVDTTALRDYRTEVEAQLKESDAAIRSYYRDTVDLSDVEAFLDERWAALVSGGLKRSRKIITKAKAKWINDRQHFNIDSPPQVAKWLYEDLGLKGYMDTDGGKPSVKLESLDRVLRRFRKKDEPHREALLHLFHRSRLQTIKERYLRLPLDPDGRVRPSIKMYGTETGRLAYADPPLQQWPKEARHVFKARGGSVFLSVDYSQLEARILAYLADDQASIRVFEAGGDVHASNARDLFGWSVEEWADLAPEVREGARNYAKTFLYGISYGGAPETMKTKTYCPCPKCVLGVPPTRLLNRAEVKRTSERWFYLHRPVLDWRRSVVQRVAGKYGTHSYTTPLGRKRYFFAPWPIVQREIYNFPMQALASEIVDRATKAVHYELAAPLVLQMHDELVFEVLEADLMRWAQAVKGIMERPVVELKGVVFPTEAASGPNLRDLKQLAVTA